MRRIHEYVERMRHMLRLDKLPAFWRKLLVIIFGGAAFAAGVVMIVTPGPAFVFIPLGLFLLASEFKWAERWAERLIRGIESLQEYWRARKRRRAAARS